MTKTEFENLLHRYTRTTRSEAEKILELRQQYPYSQLLHILAARVSRDHNLDPDQKIIQTAAIHSADRHILKQLLSEKYIKSTEHSSSKPIDYANEVLQDIKRLHSLQQAFEKLSSKIEDRKSKSEKTKTQKKSITSKKRIVKVSKKQTSVKESVKKTTKKLASKKNIKQKKKEITDRFITEIKLFKKEITPKNAKQREQLKIIEQFIKTQPTINTRNRNTSTPSEDLAYFKQGEFSNPIISETLVNLLISQGKKEKAIEVLEKLIWKFPQKKAYFANQIEKLKK